MGGVDADIFRKRYKTSEEIEDFLTINVLFKDIKLTVKMKEETFKEEKR